MEEKSIKYNYELKCITCGKTFLSNRSTAKYCCQFCKNQQLRIQKGENVKFTDDGLVIVKAKPYTQRKPVDKFAIPQNAESCSFTYWHKHGSNQCYDISCRYNYDNGYINDVLKHEDKGYYIYKKEKTCNRYRLVKRVNVKTYEDLTLKGRVEFNKYKVELIVYEWTKKKYPKKELKKYYDDTCEIVDF